MNVVIIKVETSSKRSGGQIGAHRILRMANITRITFRLYQSLSNCVIEYETSSTARSQADFVAAFDF